MSRQLAYTRGLVVRDQSTADTITFVGATEGTKRDGIELRMDGAKLDRYRHNPVFLYSHNSRQLPIGRSKRTEVDGDKLMFDIAFDREDEFAATVERKYRDGYLNAASIGFAVDEWEDPKTMNYLAGGVATEWELFELSGVTLPMDPDAVVDGRGFDPELAASLRGLLDRLDAPAIAQLRGLFDAATRLTTAPSPEPGSGRDETSDEAAPRLHRARQQLMRLRARDSGAR